MGTLAGWTFCPRCKTELTGDPSRLECPACGFVTYAGSEVSANALCVDDAGRVLLGRRARAPEAGLWDLPGGFLEEGEHPLDGLRRELREETGLDADPLRFFGVWMDRYGEGEDAPCTLNLVWTARLAAGEPRAADDVSELRWFGAGELPAPEECAFTTTAGVLLRWRDEHA
ncbi:MAG: NUDIX hydrolase [Actinobacteria bacterium]|nr:NUDIX hydrolase [Actinomycetota bacterium]